MIRHSLIITHYLFIIMKKIDKQIIGIISGMTLVAVSILPALAETGAMVDVKAGIKADRADLKVENKAKVDAMKTENKDDRTAMKGDIKTRLEATMVDVKAMRAAGATQAEIQAKLDALRTANQADREAFRKQIEEKRKTLKDDILKEITAFKDGKKIKLSDASKAQVKQKLNTVFTKLNAAIGKFAGFDKRLSDEIQNRKAKGLDTAVAEANLELARRALEESKVAISSVNAAVTASLDSTDGASKEAIRAVIKTAVDSLKTTKEKYQEVIKSLPKVKVSATASTTVESK